MNGSEGAVWQRKIKPKMDQERADQITSSFFSQDSDHMDMGCKKNRGKDKNKRKNYPLLSFPELPNYMKDNEFILNYYRANWPIKQAFFSLFRWHNETLNVWTHLVGFLLFLGLTICNLMHVPQVADFITIFTGHLPSSSSDSNVSHNHKEFPLQGQTKLIINLRQDSQVSSRDMATESWPFYVFLAGSMFCLFSSCVCHLFSCHSHKLNLLLLQMDYVGITVMIITSFFPPIYYIFQCTPHWQIVYLTGITIIGICTVVTLFSPACSTSKFRSFRACLFMAMGFFGLIPAIHALVVNWDDPRRNVTLAYELVMALSYLIGTMFYVSRIPERWRPGLFDLAGHSHNIFHVFVIMGALAHYGAAQIFLKCRGEMGCD